MLCKIIEDPSQFFCFLLFEQLTEHVGRGTNGVLCSVDSSEFVNSTSSQVVL